MGQFYLYPFSPLKFLLAFAFMHMAPVSPPQAMEEKHADIVSEGQGPSSLSSFSGSDFTIASESLLLSESFLENWVSHYSPPFSMLSTDSMIPDNSPTTSYHWRYLEYLWPAISTIATRFPFISSLYSSSPSPDDGLRLGEINKSFLPANSSLLSKDFDEPFFGFHYIEDVSDEKDINPNK